RVFGGGSSRWYSNIFCSPNWVYTAFLNAGGRICLVWLRRWVGIAGERGMACTILVGKVQEDVSLGCSPFFPWLRSWEAALHAGSRHTRKAPSFTTEGCIGPDFPF
ncbi:MAG: hypothetical protein ABFR33_10510, partial [Verrucomicrobiota bacterium]